MGLFGDLINLTKEAIKLPLGLAEVAVKETKSVVSELNSNFDEQPKPKQKRVYKKKKSSSSKTQSTKKVDKDGAKKTTNKSNKRVPKSVSKA